MTKEEIKANELKSWAVTGTFHGSIVTAKTEGEARQIFHRYYKGESITHIKQRNTFAIS